jgi:uncharacterized protein (TIGR03790 family)
MWGCAAFAVIGPDNVLVLYNQASPEGTQIANYYAQVHPGVRLLGLSGVSTAEEVSADYYLSTIRPQVLPALTSATQVLITTKGLPLRISTAPHTNPSTYVDPFGVTRTIYSTTWRPYSSLESELTRVDRISTWQQMIDQTYISPITPTNPSKNPYYKCTAAFDYAVYGTRLASRLDGFTVADVQGSIDRAQRAFIMDNARDFVLDNDPTAPAASNNLMPQLRSNVLVPRGQTTVYESTGAAVTTAPGPVIAYDSHGKNNGSGALTPGYITAQLRFNLANGAVFQTYESYNAYSFRPGGNRGGQGLVAEWLQIGGTAAVGHVEEPLTGATNVANDDQMFKMLLDGRTWAEAAWSSMQQLSFVNTVVGDPLMTWHRVIPGDANLDGTVDSSDLDVLLAYWGGAGQSGGAMWPRGDFNADGRIDAADMDILSSNLGQVANWRLPPSSDAQSIGGPGPGTGAIPEPPTAVLAVAGLLAGLAVGLRNGMRAGRGASAQGRP